MPKRVSVVIGIVEFLKHFAIFGEDKLSLLKEEIKIRLSSLAFDPVQVTKGSGALVWFRNHHDVLGRVRVQCLL